MLASRFCAFFALCSCYARSQKLAVAILENMFKRTIVSLVVCSAVALNVRSSKLAPELPPAALSRRAWGDAAAWGAAAAWVVAAPAAQALVSAPICASGVGDGCEELADSPLIAELQARSAAKREQRRKESLERYSVNNFNDFFAVDNKSLVRHADGAAAASLFGETRLTRRTQARSRRCRRTSSPRA